MNNDLISRSALLNTFCNQCGTGGRCRIPCVDYDQVAQAPAVDAEPVRHGRWLILDYSPAWTKCSECGCCWEWGMIQDCNASYCPNCGAKMDAEGNHDQT